MYKYLSLVGFGSYSSVPPSPSPQVNSGGRGPVSAEWMVPKALWLRENEPHVYSATTTLCEYQDFINLRLTGRRCASANNLAVRWHWDAKRGEEVGGGSSRTTNRKRKHT